MRVVFGVLSLLLALVVVLLVARSNLRVVQPVPLAHQNGAAGSVVVPQPALAEEQVRTGLRDAAAMEQRQRDAIDKP